MKIGFLILAIFAFLVPPTYGPTTIKLGVSPHAPADSILYVKPTPTGDEDCSTWANACGLQTALYEAIGVSEIWVAEGVYYPAIPVYEGATFSLKNGVELYGGFAGNETTRDERDWAANLTILSGAGIARHVVTSTYVDATTILDGFTVTGGHTIVWYDPSSPNFRGGGMFNDHGSPLLVNMIFSGNSASFGAGMYNSSSSPTLVNVTFINNTAEKYTLDWTCYVGKGGGMYNSSSSPTLVNVTFINNTAEKCSLISGKGGGIYSEDSLPTVTNAILWGNTPDQIDGPANVEYSDVQGGYSGEGNINADPLLVDADNGNLRLQFTSPAIDAGNNAGVPLNITTDLDGSPRKVDIPTVPDTGYGTPPIVDMGAYEAQDGSDIIYVDKDAPGAIHDGKSWANAFTELQTALATATDGGQIWVAEGVYYPGIPGNLRATFSLKNSVELYGGFAGNETYRDERDWATNLTILSGDIDRDGITDHGNAHHVVSGYGVDADAVLDGFTVTAGNADGPDTHWGWGGGMYMLNSDLSIRNVLFESNSASGGGGVFIDGGEPKLENVGLAKNTATVNGGGLHTYHGATPTLTGLNFNGNQAEQWGGGMYTLNSSPTLTDATFSANLAESGGGMFVDSGAPELVNVVFSQNTATINGGGLHTYHGATPKLVNVTISGNSAVAGAGIFIPDSNLTLMNTIVWDNTPTQNQIFNFLNTLDVTYSDIQGGCPDLAICDHVIDTDPLFVDAAGGNLRLQLTSPAIDAGNNAAVPVGVVTDLDGNPRFIDIATVDDTGYGTPPIVDMGAYEVQGTQNFIIHLPLLIK